ncbi:c-type cytochrome biogenesis protein CcmI [Arenibacterium sp. CAU 1754]
MMSFWIVASGMALIVAALLGLVLLRGRGAAAPAAAYDIQVYKDQLSEVDRDLASGVIGEADAERVRTEVSRRILAADAQLRAAETRAGGTPGGTAGLAVLVAALLIGGSLLMYQRLGAPGYGDLALASRIEMAEEARVNRPDQATAEAGLPPQPMPENLPEDYLALVQKLRDTVAERPDDVRGHALLARHEAATGNLKSAYEAQGRVLSLKGDEATAQEYADYADMMILAAGGYVSPEAENALRATLTRDPKNGIARYYWGLMMGQTGRPDMAFRVWNALLREGPADAPWIGPIREQIEGAAQLAGVDFEMPSEDAPLRGPSAAEIAAAGDMSGDERQQMIRGMVQNLSDRLATEGGPPNEWARLISALGVLGEKDQAQAIYDNAREVFAGDDSALSTVADAAERAGLGQ